MLVMPTGAKRISSRSTFYYKRVFPALFFMIPVVVLTGMLSANWGAQGIPVVAWAMPILVTAVGYLVFKLLLSDLVDEVWDHGNDLIVVNGGHAEPIALAEIMNISYSGLTNPKRATLQLRHPGRWGNKLTFIPRRSMARLFGLLGNEMIDELVTRVDQARRVTANSVSSDSASR